MKVTRTERGWAGHHILAGRCRFRRNTLLTKGNTQIVVSTVGLSVKLSGDGFDPVNGLDGYFETMAFLSDAADNRWHDMDAGRLVPFDSPRVIRKIDADDKTNDMHEAVVCELIQKLKSDELL